MLKVGIIGIGFMGYTHFEAAKSADNVTVAGIATRSAKKRDGDWTGIQGNFGPPAGQVDLSGVKTYSDYHDLLADPDIDLIDICLPTDQHHQVVMDSIAAGKATLVEKPIAVSQTEAIEMVQAAEAAQVPLLVGHVLPYFPEFQYAAQAIQSGEYGQLQGAHFRRVICPPDWSDGMTDFRKLGGWGIDLHIHDNHFIAHACGRPTAVFSNGLLQDGFVNHVHSSYVFGNDGPAVTTVSGGIAASGMAFGHGFELYLEDATIVFDAGTYAGEWVVNRPLSLIRNDGSVTAVDLGANDSWCAAFTLELQQAAAHVLEGADAGALSCRVALDALKMCYAEAESMQKKQVVEL
ncbi:MAG: Gfo/Idh/MocA family oxidoreductase [Fuerstiella sp.]